ncbi:MAG: DUF1343 domain-containing protein [Epulopiscium sp.]|nr:DUF1343 domain-containing protein [Candidatus Epulonipiscium sp.]
MANQVLCGIDNVQDCDSILANKRIALITNPTGVNKDLQSTVDVLNQRYDVTLLFSPEHGVRGDKQAGEHVATYKDDKTGIQVYSLYGKTRTIPEELNDQYDVLVYDIQDIGSRYYTYISTLLNCMESCKKNQKSIVVLDRPNPIGGEIVEGNILETPLLSFVGCHEMPQRYGLTTGEFAMMANVERGIHCDLHVVKMKNYKRSMYYDETGLSYINPSPNIPNLDSQVLYNGTCLFEGTSLSEGRGTTKPFEIIGAPWIDGDQLADIMNEKGLPGLRFRSTYFVPTFSKHKDQMCQGVQIHVLDKKQVKAVELGVQLLFETKKMTTDMDFFVSPPFESEDLFIDKLSGTKDIRLGSQRPEELLKKWDQESEKFKQIKEKYHLYE